MEIKVDWKTEFLECDSLEQAINMAIGAASACWDNLEGAGVFQSDRARDISDALVELIRDYVR